jgi:hypothetical protein
MVITCWGYWGARSLVGQVDLGVFDFAIAAGIALPLIRVYALVDRIIGSGRLALFFITSQLTTSRHLAVFLFVVCAPWVIPRQVPMYYGVMVVSLAVAYPSSSTTPLSSPRRLAEEGAGGEGGMVLLGLLAGPSTTGGAACGAREARSRL